MTNDTDAQDRIEDLLERGLRPEHAPYTPTPGERAAIGPDGIAELMAQHEAELAAWRIDGERTATWAATKLARARRIRAEAAETAARLRAIADEHEAEAARMTDHDVAYFTGKLREYHEDVIAGSKRKTTALPGGIKLTTRAGTVSTKIPAETEAERAAREELVAWLEDHHPEALDYAPPKIAKKELAVYDGKVDGQPGIYPAVDADTGEVVPHVTFVRPPETFDVVGLDDYLTRGDTDDA